MTSDNNPIAKAAYDETADTYQEDINANIQCR